MQVATRSDCRCRRQTYTYDGAGNKLTETDPLGRTTSFAYDSLDRLIETRYADGTRTTITYDALGQIIAQTNQLGNPIQFEYDERNRNTAIIDAFGQRTEYNYDKVGNLLGIKDANGHITNYEYDALDRRTTTILPLGQRSITTYDAIGNTTSTTDFNGNTITYSYDVMNRLSSKRLGNDNTVSYSYTSTDRLQKTVNAQGTTSYSYDVRDRLIARTEVDGKTIQYSYDPVGNRLSIATASGTTSYSYDRYNQLKTVTTSDGGITDYTYDKAGNVTHIQKADGTIETLTYDSLNQLTKQETKKGTEVIASYTYTLDAAGKRVQISEYNGRKVDYSYDQIDRLLSEQITDATNGNRTVNYSYDAIANRLSKSDSVDGITTYTYDDNDRLLAETTENKTTTYTYDNNGNNLTRSESNSQTVNTWDLENRLTQTANTTNGITDITQYRYDSDGIRIASETNGNETRYLVDTNLPYAQVLLEYKADGTPIVEYVYGLNLIEQEREGVKSFYHADGLGSTRFLTDSNGNVTDTYIYDAYGNILSSIGQTVNNYLYTGEQFDPNLEEYYLRARYYDPSVGRFTARDPFEGFLTEPLSLAKYPYVHGNPVNATDPSGLLIQEITVASSVQNTLQASSFTSSIVAVKLGLYTIEKYNLAYSKVALRNCNLTGDKDCQAGVPIVFYGDMYGLESLRETTAHIKDAITITIANTPLLSAYLNKPSNHGSSGWYKSKGECGGKGRHEYKAKKLEEGITLVNSNIGCDEYPFNSSEQGGLANYNKGLVSLRNVPIAENSPQGNLMDGNQLTKAGVLLGDTFNKWYGVVAIPNDLNQSFWQDRQGNKFFHSRITNNDR